MIKKSFTLIELIVVIAIIAILAGVVAPNAFKAIEKAKISRAVKDMRVIKSAALAFYTDTGTWPLIGIGGSIRGTGAGFMTNDDGNGNTVRGWNGPYLEKWPINPWGDPSSNFGNQYYWDADRFGDDNANGIVAEAQVIMFNVPRASALVLDERYDNGILTGSGVGGIYQNMVVSPDPNANRIALNWMVKEPIE